MVSLDMLDDLVKTHDCIILCCGGKIICGCSKQFESLSSLAEHISRGHNKITRDNLNNDDDEECLQEHFRKNFSFPQQHKNAVTITLPDECEDEFSVSVQYSTSPLSPALVWLTKHQTAGLQQPFMFSQGTTITCHLSNIFFQGQAILNRALFPCQDTPAVKTPFQATVRVDKRVSAVMSALSVADPLIRDDDVREYKFSQPIPIPSYLVAIAVGDLTSRELGPRSRVYAEHEYIDKAAHDFSDTEAQLNIAEQLCGPYLWTRLINLYQIDVNV